GGIKKGQRPRNGTAGGSDRRKLCVISTIKSERMFPSGPTRRAGRTEWISILRSSPVYFPILSSLGLSIRRRPNAAISSSLTCFGSISQRQKIFAFFSEDLYAASRLALISQSIDI